MKKKLVLIIGLLGGFVIMPILWYLIYKVLTMVGATELMWFLFWIYIPVGAFVHILTQIAKNMKDE